MIFFVTKEKLKNIDFEDMVLRMNLIYTEIEKKIDIKLIGGNLQVFELPPSVYEIVDFKNISVSYVTICYY